MFCRLVVLVRLSVVQVTGKTFLRNDLQCVDGDVKLYSLIHSLRELSFAGEAATIYLRPLQVDL